MNSFKNIFILISISVVLYASSLLIEQALQMYQNNTLKDNQKIIARLKQAAQQNNRDASFVLATAYKNGKIGENDYLQAIQWYEKAAKLGDADSMLMLGWIYYEGKSQYGTNEQKAKYWFSKAAKMGIEEAVEMMELLNS